MQRSLLAAITAMTMTLAAGAVAFGADPLPDAEGDDASLPLSGRKERQLRRRT